MFPVEELQLVAVELAVGLQPVQNVRVHDAGEKVVEDDPLIMKSNNLLQRREGQPRVIVDRPIVKLQEQALKLRDDAVLIIPRVSDQRAARVGAVARQIRRHVVERVS